MITEKTLHKLAVLGGQSFDDREGLPRAGLPRRFPGSDIPAVFPVVRLLGQVARDLNVRVRPNVAAYVDT